MRSLSLASIIFITVISFLFPNTVFAGEITFYTSIPNDDLTFLTTEFSRHYPETKVSVFRSGTIEIQKKILAENRAGKVYADVIMISDHLAMENLKRENILSPMLEIDASKLPLDTFDKDKFYFGTKFIKIGFLMHKGKKERPTQWAQLIDVSNTFYKIIAPNPDYSGAAKYTFNLLSGDKRFGPTFVDKLKEKIHMVVGNEQVAEMVSLRPSTVGIVVDFMARKKIKKNRDLVFYYPDDFNIYITEPITITNDSKNRKEALDFVRFVLSPEGQLCFQELGYTPLYKQVNST